MEKLKEIMSDAATYPDPQAEVKQLLDQIGQRGEGLVDKMENEVYAEEDDVEAMKTKNDQWKDWMGTLALGMAKNGALFNQLLGVYEFYLKELKGRVGDLESVNNSFYTDKGATAETEIEEKSADKEQEKEKEEDGYEVGFHSRDRTGSTFFNLEPKQLDDEDGDAVEQKETDVVEEVG